MEVMFADDTNLFLSYKNIDILFASMKVELDYNKCGLYSTIKNLNK